MKGGIVLMLNLPPQIFDILADYGVMIFLVILFSVKFFPKARLDFIVKFSFPRSRKNDENRTAQ